MTPQSAKSATRAASKARDVLKDGGMEEGAESPREIVLAKRLVASYHLENGGAVLHLLSSDDTTVVRNGVLAVTERNGLILVAAVIYPMEDGLHAIRYDPDVSPDILADIESDHPGQVVYAPRDSNGEVREYVGVPQIASAVEPADRPLASYEKDHICQLFQIAMQMTAFNGTVACGPRFMQSSMLRRLIR